MEEVLQDLCDRLGENRNRMVKEFIWVPESMRAVCAVVFTCSGETANAARLRMSAEILNREERFYSEFRGTLRPTVLAKMAMAENPEQYYRQLRRVYDLLGEPHDIAGEQRLLSALHLAQQAQTEHIRDTVDRTLAICQQMRKLYPSLSGPGDYPMAAALASHRLNPQMLFEEMERCHWILREQLQAGTASSVCCHLLALSGSPAEEKCRKLFAIWNGLKSENHRFGIGKELAVLAALTLFTVPAEETVRQIGAADDCLRKKKGFDFLRIGVAQRRMYAADLVLMAYIRRGLKIGDAAIPGTTALEVMRSVCEAVTVSTSASVLPPVF